MTWESDIERHIMHQNRQVKRAFAAVAGAMHESVVDGSQITTAPGQPVRTGNLRSSWNLGFPASFVAETLTNVDYAQDIEELDTPLRSTVGGHHSVKLTRANFGKLVAHAVEGI